MSELDGASDAGALARRLQIEIQARAEVERRLKRIADDLVRTKEDLRRQARAAQAFSVTFEATTDGLALTDADGLFIHMNSAHLHLFGYDHADEVIGKPWTILYQPAVVEWITSKVMPVLFKTRSWRGELLGVTRNGAPVPQDVTLTLVEGNGILCATRDITERLRTEEERAALAAIIRETENRESVARIAADISHDMGNLLAAIRFSAALITDHEQATQTISRALDQAVDLLTDLNLLDRKLGPMVEPYSLVEVARGCLDVAYALAPDRIQIALVQDLDDDVCVAVDRSLLQRTLINLIKNASEAISESGVVEIGISAARPDVRLAGASSAIFGAPLDGDQIWLTVSDTGEGMTPERLQDVMRPYVSTKITNDGAIRGLGFSSLLTLVKAAGAYAEIWSLKDVGTTVRLQIPRTTS